MTEGQVTLILTNDQLEQVEALVAKRKKKDRFVSRMRVLRELIEAGLQQIKA
jgi:hypothetical protein